MGCFSFKCKECNKGVNSSSFDGELVEIFLLKEGKVLQHMSGEYDSYGRVFLDNTQNSSVNHDLRESVQWDRPWNAREQKEDEPTVMDLMWSHNPDSNGMALIPSNCWAGDPIPPTCREDDTAQGWNPISPLHCRPELKEKCLADLAEYNEEMEDYDSGDREDESEH